MSALGVGKMMPRDPNELFSIQKDGVETIFRKREDGTIYTITRGAASASVVWACGGLLLLGFAFMVWIQTRIDAASEVLHLGHGRAMPRVKNPAYFDSQLSQDIHLAAVIAALALACFLVSLVLRIRQQFKRRPHV
jgi:hypothetical protein